MRSLVWRKEDSDDGPLPADQPSGEESLPSIDREEAAPIQRTSTPKRRSRLLKSLRCIAPRCSSPQRDEEYFRAREEQLRSRQDEIDETVDYLVSNLSNSDHKIKNKASPEGHDREIVNYSTIELSPNMQAAPWRVETSYEESLASSYEEEASIENREHGEKSLEDIFEDSLEPDFVEEEDCIVNSRIENREGDEGSNEGFFDAQFEAAFGGDKGGSELFADFPDFTHKFPRITGENSKSDIDLDGESHSIQGHSENQAAFSGVGGDKELFASFHNDKHGFPRITGGNSKSDINVDGENRSIQGHLEHQAAFGGMGADKELFASFHNDTHGFPRTTGENSKSDVDVDGENRAIQGHSKHPMSPDKSTGTELDSTFEQSSFGQDSSDDGELVESILEKAKDGDTLFELEDNSLPPPRNVVKGIVKSIERGGLDQSIPKIKRTPAIFGAVQESTSDALEDASVSSIGVQETTSDPQEDPLVSSIGVQETTTDPLEDSSVPTGVQETTDRLEDSSIPTGVQETISDPPDESSVSSIGFTSCTNNYPVRLLRDQRKSELPRPLFWRSHPGNGKKYDRRERISISLQNLPAAPRPRFSYNQQPLGSLLS